MQYWLMKSEASDYSIDDLERDGVTAWTGVRNYQARNIMRDEMAPGDLVLYYHSNASPSAVVGIARVVSEPYPDPTQFDEESGYHDPKATPKKPRWWLVDIQFVEKLPRAVSLQEVKADSRFGEMALVKRSRLSVQPVRPTEFEDIRSLADQSP
jgi:predicted RNA-binding protein with PUA-like domain